MENEMKIIFESFDKYDSYRNIAFSMRTIEPHIVGKEVPFDRHLFTNMMAVMHDIDAGRLSIENTIKYFTENMSDILHIYRSMMAAVIVLGIVHEPSDWCQYEIYNTYLAAHVMIDLKRAA